MSNTLQSLQNAVDREEIETGADYGLRRMSGALVGILETMKRRLEGPKDEVPNGL